MLTQMMESATKANFVSSTVIVMIATVARTRVTFIMMVLAMNLVSVAWVPIAMTVVEVGAAVVARSQTLATTRTMVRAMSRRSVHGEQIAAIATLAKIRATGQKMALVTYP